MRLQPALLVSVALFVMTAPAVASDALIGLMTRRNTGDTLLGFLT